MGKIYKITNDLNDEVYVGMTIKTIECRFNEHIKSAKRYDLLRDGESKLYKAMVKYGVEHFSVLLICDYPDCNDRQSLGEKEKYWILLFDSINNGYNISLGGDGGPLFKGHLHTQETKQLLSDNNYWKTHKLSPEYIEKRVRNRRKYYECIKTGEIVYTKDNITHDFTWWVTLDDDQPLPESVRLELYNKKVNQINLNLKEGVIDNALHKIQRTAELRKLIILLLDIDSIISLWLDGYSLVSYIKVAYELTGKEISAIKWYILLNSIQRNRTFRRLQTDDAIKKRDKTRSENAKKRLQEWVSNNLETINNVIVDYKLGYTYKYLFGKYNILKKPFKLYIKLYVKENNIERNPGVKIKKPRCLDGQINK